MTETLNYFNYFTEIEDVFVRLRGKHIFISPLDWVLIEQWKAKGIPLYVAIRGIETAFASHAATQKRRAVKTLMYCQEEVEAQYAEWLDSQVGATDAVEEGAVETPKPASALPFPREAILEHLARGLSGIRALRQRRAEALPALGEELDRVAARLEELTAGFAGAAAPNAEALEDGLSELERILHAALLRELPPEELAAARRGAEEQLKPYKARMEKAVYEQTRDGLVQKQLLEQNELDRLSLFYL